MGARPFGLSRRGAASLLVSVVLHGVALAGLLSLARPEPAAPSLEVRPVEFLAVGEVVAHPPVRPPSPPVPVSRAPRPRPAALPTGTPGARTLPAPKAPGPAYPVARPITARPPATPRRAPAPGRTSPAPGRGAPGPPAAPPTHPPARTPLAPAEPTPAGPGVAAPGENRPGPGPGSVAKGGARSGPAGLAKGAGSEGRGFARGGAGADRGAPGGAGAAVRTEAAPGGAPGSDLGGAVPASGGPPAPTSEAPPAKEPLGTPEDALEVGPNLGAAGKPLYPEEALEEGVEGTVVLAALLGADGRVREVRVVSRSVDRRLDRAACEWARALHLSPVLGPGRRPVEAWIRGPVIFRLNR